MTFKRLPGLLKLTFNRWNDHNAPRLGAALAFYSLLSLAPSIVLLVALCGVVFRKPGDETQVLRAARQFFGNSGSEAALQLINGARHPAAGVLATIVAFISLFFGASGVFYELRSSLNLIWDSAVSETFSLKAMIKDRLFAFLMIGLSAVFLFASLLLSTVLGILEKFTAGIIPLPAAIFGELANFAITLISLSLLFAFIFKFIPNRRISWRDVTIGAIATALFFSLGKLLLSLYLSIAAVGSTYGAAGSLVAFVVWAYYSAQIFFFGAEFTRVYADAQKPNLPQNDVPPTLKRVRTA
ncbi:MAG TPA: YihY/virulence factor BrkB family protein [Bryobacteraceae bacterium]|nr:YihY/virulence factor BrkB family protein [Bryobacteraceae bacterium]